jgi:SlyX protein
MHDESLERVESKIAFLERSIAELSDVVFRQHQEIQALEAKLKALKERMEDTSADRVIVQERPPHY